MKPGPKPADPLQRFINRTNIDGGDCWTWTGSINKDTGYGQFFMDGRNQTAQVAAYRLFIGEVPEGDQVDHVCHNEDLTCPGGLACPHRLCVNPAHLETVTRSVNQLRAYERRRKAVAA